MKPRDLKPPFPLREERRVMIEDRVWYVPDMDQNEEQFSFPGWSDPQLFGNENPVHVEYCSGNGDWLIEKASKNRDVNWVAVEIKFMRSRKIWSKLKNHGLTNVVVLCGEGKRATKQYFPAASVSAVHVNFPDPWPKRRHAKHRLIEPLFVEDLSRILKPQAVATLVTDDLSYSEIMIEEMKGHPLFSSRHPHPYYITDDGGYGSSYFEQLWRRLGRTIYLHQFVKGKS